MKTRPIIFSAPMVRALIDGSKTQTRRVVKPQPVYDGRFAGGWKLIGKSGHEAATCSPLIAELSPYGGAGDRLWVRETWAYGIHALASNDYEAEGPWVYAADNPKAHGRLCDRWRPSIHMFRAASRITLEITGVRVERLQDISEADAKAEGIAKTPSGFWSTYGQTKADGTYSPKTSYRALWESINGPESWATNPWVWVLEFKRVKGPSA